MTKAKPYTKITYQNRDTKQVVEFPGVYFEYEYLPTQEEVREHIRSCEGKHSQQVAYSTFHDSLTQICFGCKKVRSNLRRMP